MEAINRAERNTSLINFTAVYLIIIALPVVMAFFAGNRKNAGAMTSSSAKEYETLEKQMTELQAYTARMREHDDKLANMNNASPAQWQSWLDEAKRENKKFEDAIEKFRGMKFKDARSKMQTSVCTYLDGLHTERAIHLQYMERQRGISNQNLTVQQLQNEKQQLQAQNASLQNTINTQNALLAQKPAGGSGGGGGQDNQVLTDLKWQLRFEDADCKKSQADLLAAYKADATRKKLYSTAKTNFQQIAQMARTSFSIQRQATAKVREIDQTLSQL
ncbi:hypothetical protein DYU11_09100 [Fibrisoma montanum]|uniref:Uncharacterized protein n=1 Tax=Fibrisoma montanum TaxID=2305895 RepID=A0A418MFA8_9BACT|nr:hypothetical protein [Fibrisoma montanum]RIV25445.1 hypothetical protein DYU11_09100 [Fibrisoma montanum]